MAIQIRANVVGNNISLATVPVIASGAVGTNEVAFTFSDDWTGFTKTAVFKKESGTVFTVPLDTTTNTAQIPQQAIDNHNRLTFGVMGLDDGVQLSSSLITYNIVEGAAEIVNNASDVVDDPDWQLGIASVVSNQVSLMNRLDSPATTEQFVKPCPLMPDGEWYRVIVKVTSTDEATTPTMTFATYSDNSSVVNARTANYTSDGISVKTSANYRMLECRMAVAYDNATGLSSTICMQNSSGWQMWTGGDNQYVICSASYMKNMKIGLTFIVWTYITSNTVLNNYCTNLLEDT